MQSGIKYRWIVKRYEGENAKSILGHVRAGIGYYEVESGTGYVVAACRIVGPVPNGCTEVTDPEKVASLERRRIGSSVPSKRQSTATINDVFFNGSRKDVS